MAGMMLSLAGITWGRLEAEDAVCYPLNAESGLSDEVIFTSGFPTPNGRAKIVPVDLLPSAELPDSNFLLVLTTGRMLEHWHTGAMTRCSTMLNAQEPVPVVSMHPKDIGRNGFVRGQKVEVETRRVRYDLGCGRIAMSQKV
jgi:formate dehydrogenase major subunit